MPTPPRPRPVRHWSTVAIVLLVVGTVVAGPASAAIVDPDLDTLPSWFERDVSKTDINAELASLQGQSFEAFLVTPLLDT